MPCLCSRDYPLPPCLGAQPNSCSPVRCYNPIPAFHPKATAHQQHSHSSPTGIPFTPKPQHTHSPVIAHLLAHLSPQSHSTRIAQSHLIDTSGTLHPKATVHSRSPFTPKPQHPHNPVTSHRHFILHSHLTHSHSLLIVTTRSTHTFHETFTHLILQSCVNSSGHALTDSQVVDHVPFLPLVQYGECQTRAHKDRPLPVTCVGLARTIYAR
jgi:hypothetical protein